jgi:tetratricopeptide (TPR) repeat protein
LGRFPTAVLLSALTLAVMTAPPAAAQDEAPRGKRHALLVGVKTYDHDALPDLKHTEHDVEELAKLLRGRGADFRVVLLTNTRGRASRAAMPTAANIRARLKTMLDKVTKHDTVLVALAGHGVQRLVVDSVSKKEREEAFFCPADARIRDTKDRAELGKTLISLNDLFHELQESGAGVKLLLVDACRNDPKEARSLDVDTLPKPPRGIGALFSCSSGQRAFETDKLGGGHGVFFHYVLEGLKGGARNEDGEVTWDRLGEYVKKQVSEQVPRLIGSGAQQSPHGMSNISGRSPVVLRLSALLRAQVLLEQHDYDGAVEAFSAAIREAPDEPMAYVGRAQALQYRHRMTEAVRDCAQALRRNRRLALAYAVRSHLLCNQTDLSRAQADAEEALRLEPGLAWAHAARGVVHSLRRDRRPAIAELTEAVRLDPKFALAYAYRGLYRSKFGEHQTWRTDFAEAIRLDPRNPYVYDLRGWAHWWAKNYGKAFADFAVSIRLDPKCPWPYNSRGSLYSDRKEYGRALADYNESIRVGPEFAWPYCGRSFEYTRRSQFEKALADARQACRIAPNYAPAHNARGVCYQNRKRYGKAIDAYTRAIRLDPKEPVYYENRAYCYEQTGKKKAAREDRAKARRLRRG